MADHVGSHVVVPAIFRGTKLYDKIGSFIHEASNVVVPPADTTPPVVSYVSPSPGGALLPADVVDVDVTDDSGSLARAMLAVAFEDGTQELAYDGTLFTPRFSVGSSVSAIAGGFRFSLARTSGWSGASITVRAFAVDPSGNLEQ